MAASRSVILLSDDLSALPPRAEAEPWEASDGFVKGAAMSSREYLRPASGSQPLKPAPMIAIRIAPASRAVAIVNLSMGLIEIATSNLLTMPRPASQLLCRPVD